ncbi:hypothetical protein [Micromonospora sp. WMMD710]|uniref:hypothetical protein n=1 Tax=Micromonospora sp. WMMD710 TaxID=3016085 RepID=UPI002417B61E|nr:hypothetical protein [Micromonospora sp. WMMD710]MDG4760182.1 hypothetical protein [Micromonospora sp. WMMD710]
MTGRRAARDHDDRHTGPAVDDDAGSGAGGSRSAGVAPQPRVVPGIDPGSNARPSPARTGEQRPTPAGRAGAAGLAATPARPTPAAPAPTPARPTPASPVPSPARPAPPGPAAGSGPTGHDPVEVVEVEPTTGAPVDAVPRRVPVRQQSRWHRGSRRSDGDAPTDDSAFWAPIEQVHWDGTPVREDAAPERERGSGPAGRRSAARTPRPPDPLPGLTVLVLLSLVVAFFAWVSAGPFWLAVGHARVGTVLIDDCTGGGLTQRCRGIFTADDGRFLAHGVRVSGVPDGRDAPGTSLPARMTGPDGGTAYADTGVGRHLRWLPGLLMVIGCAAGIARWTGSTRLPGRRHRRWAVAAALAGPALITLGFLAAAW